jgi:serine/threonine protein kinase
MKPSTDHLLQSDQHSFLQNSSLLTHKPSEQHDQQSPTVLPKADQKIVSPTQPVLAQLDDQGAIRIDLSVPASALILGRLLGKGGFGAVYEGVYQGKPVAIKQLSGHLSADALIELKREAEIMFQLGISSEHIVKLIKICLETPYSLVMELMPQGSLYDVLRNGQDLPWPTRYQIAADSAQGLSDLHERKILHRDLKSLNILLRNGRAKLADFGLAKVKHETGSQSSVTAKGTVLWMAPELFDDEPKVTTASDIYSFGMVLWELVTRQLPYTKAPNPMVAARWIEKGKKEEIPGDCPSELKRIIESCWETTPAKRPTAIGVLTDLKPLAEQKVSPPNDSDSEINKLKAQMEQMKLAYERQMVEEKQKAITQLQLAHEHQLQAAAEEKQRLEAEKQQREKELERLKQQHQEELKSSQEESKLSKLKPSPQTIATPTKSRPIPLVSQTVAQTMMLMPKPKANPEQLALQDQLIAACKQGDKIMVMGLLKQGAKPDMPDAKGEQPLGAAVWGMCPDVVNALLKEAKGIAPMTWEECEKHNQRFYQEVFIVPKFDPQTFKEWNDLLQKIDPNPFVRAFHLKKADEHWQGEDSSSWENLKSYMRRRIGLREGLSRSRYFGRLVPSETEQGYVGFRTQIKQSIESASRPTGEINTLQQHETDLKGIQKDLKYESPLQPPKSTASLPLISQTIAQTILSPPKPTTSAEQLKLQDQLIAACKQGDEKRVTALLKRGAKPDMSDAKGEQPLGAAVWGMCPDVVNALLKEAKGIAPMTWDECEKHNIKYYKEVFLIPKFDPKTFGEWNTLLQKMDPNLFIRAFHLKKADEQWHDSDSSSWERLKKCVAEVRKPVLLAQRGWNAVRRATDTGYVSFRSQIEQSVESASRPTVTKTFWL